MRKNYFLIVYIVLILIITTNSYSQPTPSSVPATGNVPTSTTASDNKNTQLLTDALTNQDKKLTEQELLTCINDPGIDQSKLNEYMNKYVDRRSPVWDAYTNKITDGRFNANNQGLNIGYKNNEPATLGILPAPSQPPASPDNSGVPIENPITPSGNLGTVAQEEEPTVTTLPYNDIKNLPPTAKITAEGNSAILEVDGAKYSLTGLVGSMVYDQQTKTLTVDGKKVDAIGDTIEITPYSANNNPSSFPSVSFLDDYTDILFPTDSSYKIKVGENTFSSLPKENKALTQEYISMLERNAENGDLTNTDLAMLWLKAQGADTSLLTDIINEYPDGRRIFSNESLLALGNSLQDQINAGNDYLLSKAEESAREQNDLDTLNALKSSAVLDLPKSGLKTLGNAYIDILTEDNSTEMLNQAKELLKDDPLAMAGLSTIEQSKNEVAFRSYSGIKIYTDSYTATDSMKIENSKRIIIVHSGDVTENKNLIIAEDATMFWNIYNESSLFAHNIIQGRWIAFKDNKDEITEVLLQAPPLQYAILHNDDADLYMRSNAIDAIRIIYEGSNISHIIANSSYPGSGIKKMYFGKQLKDNTREHFVSGSAWEVYFKDNKIKSGSEKTLIYQVAEGRAVINLTLSSKDSFYRFLPQQYQISTSQHGDFENKQICFLNCQNISGQNTVYVREDDIGILSLGTLGNTATDSTAHAVGGFDVKNGTVTQSYFNQDWNSVTGYGLLTFP